MKIAGTINNNGYLDLSLDKVILEPKTNNRQRGKV